VLGYLILSANPGNKLIPNINITVLNKNVKRHLLDLLTAYMGGFLFVVTVRLFESIQPDGTYFDLFWNILKARNWQIGRHNFEDFIFAFIITYIIIFIRNQYKKT
tara:strand:- start:23 stop:337 length:315 start_codon:yes stop_codon:yes gene_type:complete